MISASTATRVRLIMEDQSLEGEEEMETAVRIMRESANYGVAMFPEGGGSATHN
ncbi:hypothetical protein L208DRAFT_1412661 [Tricholoma matsutake]|nr:hypothetical protein L208DRAFT_1412661 [Tricholoma matsutake 945]